MKKETIKQSGQFTIEKWFTKSETMASADGSPVYCKKAKWMLCCKGKAVDFPFSTKKQAIAEFEKQVSIHDKNQVSFKWLKELCEDDNGFFYRIHIQSDCREHDFSYSVKELPSTEEVKEKLVSLYPEYEIKLSQLHI